MTETQKCAANHDADDGNGPINDQGTTDLSNTNNNSLVPKLVVHQHVNGLCIVTAGDVGAWLSSLYPTHNHQTIQNFLQIEFVATEAPSCSAAEKRKRQAKMLKGKGNIDHIVTPLTVIAKLIVSNPNDDDNIAERTEFPLYAGVWGTIIELNHGLSPKVLLDDPLLDGYLAIILPSGSFPPR